MLPPNLVIFTDLDGSLLDHRTYSWLAAADALHELARRKIPLVFCTSKTRAEVEFLRRKMENMHPFITENGGGIFIPHGYFPQRIADAHTVKTFHCVALARPYKDVVAALQELAGECAVDVVGFHAMRPKEIAENSGLTLPQAELAKLRDFDEPFFFAGATPADEARFAALARERGFSVVRGTRFWHIHSGSDKGRAVSRLLREFRAAMRGQKVRAVGIGDAANDAPMLAAVDHPVLLPQPGGALGGSFDATLDERFPRATRASAPGPAGWNDAVLALLGQ